MSTPFYSEAAFDAAWIRGVQIAGRRFFRSEGASADSSSKWDFYPDFDVISSALGVLSTGEAVFLAAMYSFFNPDTGAELLRRLGADSPGFVAASLDEKRRRVIAELTVSYAGW